MNHSSIKPISGVQQPEGSTHSKMQTHAQIETKNESIKTGGNGNVSIHFRVDEETNDVTVFLVDRKTKKILRSIPAGELQKLQIGDLLKLTG